MIDTPVERDESIDIFSKGEHRISYKEAFIVSSMRTHFQSTIAFVQREKAVLLYRGWVHRSINLQPIFVTGRKTEFDGSVRRVSPKTREETGGSMGG
jgi:hypothetical protein